MRTEFQTILGWHYGEKCTPTQVGGRHHGPFSVSQYLRYKARRGSKGDVLDLYMFAYMFGAVITVVDGRALTETRICHSTPLSQTLKIKFDDGDHLVPAIDIVLVQTQSDHLFPCGKSLFSRLASVEVERSSCWRPLS